MSGDKILLISYIDPGTGAMLFSVLMGLVTALYYFLQKAFLKLKFFVSGGKMEKTSAEKLPFVIFSDSKRYWNVFKPICDEFEKRGVKCEYWTASPDDPALSEKYEHVVCKFIGEGNKAYARLNMMNARICLATTPGIDVYQWKRSKNTEYYVHILHEIGETTLYRMFGLDYYDAVLLSGEFQEKDIRTLENMRGLTPKEIVVVGSTYMDSMNKKAEGLVKPNNSEKVVLLAPSWGASSILNKYGKKFLSALVDTGYKIIVRPHPQSATSDPEMLKELKSSFPESDKFKWNADNDNFNVLNEADVMISDFSGVIFDYSLIFDKPIIYTDTKMDYAPYDAAWIDEPVWRRSVLPDLGRELKEEDFGNMKEIITDLIENEKYQAGRNMVRDTAWFYKGEAASRAVDYLIAKNEELLKRKEQK